MKLTKSNLEILISQTINTISTYKQIGLTIPFALKGNLGEFLVYKKLLQKFPKEYIEFVGGANPGYDIKLNKTKIQVKTGIVKRERHGLLEACPTIKKRIIDEKKCDAIVLLELYPSKNFSKIIKKNTYIFNQKDFKYFSHLACWSGKSSGDYTIQHVLEFNPNGPKKFMKIVKFYNKPKYEKLFKASENNWGKLLS